MDAKDIRKADEGIRQLHERLDKLEALFHSWSISPTKERKETVTNSAQDLLRDLTAYIKGCRRLESSAEIRAFVDQAENTIEVAVTNILHKL